MMTSALYRHSLDQDFPVAVAGDGVYLIDSEGRRYLDGSGGDESGGAKEREKPHRETNCRPSVPRPYIVRSDDTPVGRVSSRLRRLRHAATSSTPLAPVQSRAENRA